MKKPKVMCEYCKSTFALKSNHVTENSIEIKGESLVATFLTCPKCGKRYAVQIDNAETLEILGEYRIKLMKMSKIKAKGNHPKLKQIDSMTRTQNRLKRKRDKLSMRYNKSFYQYGDVKEQLDLPNVPALSGEENENVN